MPRLNDTDRSVKVRVNRIQPGRAHDPALVQAGQGVDRVTFKPKAEGVQVGDLRGCVVVEKGFARVILLVPDDVPNIREVLVNGLEDFNVALVKYDFALTHAALNASYSVTNWTPDPPPAEPGATVSTSKILAIMSKMSS